MGEPSPVAVPERREIHAGGETAKRVPRMAEDHVERVHSRDADMGEQITLITPVDLSLRARDDLEPAMQTAQRVVVGLGQLGGDPRPGFGQEHLDPLVMAGEAVLGDQPLMDHRAFDPQIRTQPPLHQRDERGDQQRLRPSPRRAFRRDRHCVLGQILTDRPPITAALPADLSKRGACHVQGAETTNVHPGLRIQDHEQGRPSGLSTWRWTTEG
jgi:hypothetical protein